MTKTEQREYLKKYVESQGTQVGDRYFYCRFK